MTKSDASDQALQTALDYACGARADCAPIQSSRLCYLPNTLQSHVSYAFNSYYQRRGNAPGSCDFSNTATVTRTDPSYGFVKFNAYAAARTLYPPPAKAQCRSVHARSLCQGKYKQVTPTTSQSVGQRQHGVITRSTLLRPGVRWHVSWHDML
ncbi:hypothetical protein TEA_015753 [Camellia sinensis var. sinensis]|uniref:X8 domain-containing protein n=2 Tax=Camellia sinensis TaxID=4442 RepID=A0A4S4EK47_CAMSN|nr:hypothetical protein TEA_015753 [Camellia sinensis var. sinensis]